MNEKTIFSRLNYKINIKYLLYFLKKLINFFKESLILQYINFTHTSLKSLFLKKSTKKAWKWLTDTEDDNMSIISNNKI